MERVVDPEDGVAPAGPVPGYRVAGKTGTAQRVGAECGCYDGTFTVSFAGFAPADDPRFTIYVVIQNPRNGGGGGSVAGPVVLQADGLHAAPLRRRPTDRTQPTRPPRRVVRPRPPGGHWSRWRADSTRPERPAAHPARRPGGVAAAHDRDARRPATRASCVTGLTLSSQRVRPGDLYAALPGARAHGIDFAGEARRRRRGRGADRPARARPSAPGRRTAARRRASRGGCSAGWPPGSTASRRRRCG